MNDMIGHLVDDTPRHHGIIRGDLYRTNDAIVVGNNDQRKVIGNETVESFSRNYKGRSADEQSGSSRLDIQLQVDMRYIGLFARE